MSKRRGRKQRYYVQLKNIYKQLSTYAGKLAAIKEMRKEVTKHEK